MSSRILSGGARGELVEYLRESREHSRVVSVDATLARTMNCNAATAFDERAGRAGWCRPLLSTTYRMGADGPQCLQVALAWDSKPMAGRGSYGELGLMGVGAWQLQQLQASAIQPAINATPPNGTTSPQRIPKAREPAIVKM
jgi:hypothetical protein